MNKNGFTLMELVVAVAVASGLAAVAVPSYQNYVAKTQAAEAEKLINAERVNLVSSMSKGHCLAPGAQSTQKGRFGTLTTSGTFVASKGLSCDSGCDVTYTFNADANKHIAGKKIVVDMRLNGDISKNASTTVDKKYLSDNLNRAGTVAAGDDCTALSNTKPTATAGIGASGTETGAAAPPPPANGGNNGNGGGNGGNSGGNSGNGGNSGGNSGNGGGNAGDNTSQSGELTLEQQVERAKTFRIIPNASTTHDVRHLASISIGIPRGEHADFYQPSNWNVNDWNTNRHYVDWGNTNWRNNYYFPNSFVIRLYDNYANVVTKFDREYCSDGSCYTTYNYTHTLKLYYKGQYIRTYTLVSRVPDIDW